MYHRAKKGDQKALEIFDEFGTHLGNAVNSILYAVDPGIIIMGGSVSKSYPFFKKSLWQSIQKLAYRSVTERLKIELSTNKDIAVLGAAALYYNARAKGINNYQKTTSRVHTQYLK